MTQKNRVCFIDDLFVLIIVFVWLYSMWMREFNNNEKNGILVEIFIIYGE